MLEHQKLNYSIVKISGDDAVKFLQSIITADINNAGNIYSLMLTPKGKFLFDFFITKIKNDYYIEIATAKLAEFIAKLKMYIFRSKVSLEHLEEYGVIYSRTRSNLKTFYEYQDPRLNKLGIRSVLRVSDIKGPESDIYIKDKYKFTIPDGCIELIEDKSMPLEYGLDALNAISYSKGCYIGQEVISRTKYQGFIRKKLFSTSSDSDLSDVEKGSDILYQNSKIGIICSSYHTLAICLIRIDNDLPLQDIMLSTTNGKLLKIE